MKFNIRKMTYEDYDSVSNIYKQGIETNNATFETNVKSYDDWVLSHLLEFSFVACHNDIVIAWISLSNTSSREVYKGVCELSIYVDNDYKKHGVASMLLEYVIDKAEENNIWTLQSGILKENKASIALHKKHGFRIVGYRDKIAKDRYGNWRDTVLMERRSKMIM